MLEIVIAYVLAGVFGVVLDARQPPYNRPAYFKGGIRGKAWAVVVWLPMVVLSTFMIRQFDSKSIYLILLFLALAVLGAAIR